MKSEFSIFFVYNYDEVIEWVMTSIKRHHRISCVNFECFEYIVSALRVCEVHYWNTDLFKLLLVF